MVHRMSEPADPSASITTSRLRATCGAWLFRGVSLTAVAALVAPVVLVACTPPFAGRTACVGFYVLVWCERTWSMYLRRGAPRACAAGGRDWTAIAVGYAYVLTMGGAAVEFLLRRRTPAELGAALWVGLALYAAAAGLRYASFYALRHQWHVDVTTAGEARTLVRAGPYRWLRHPLYAGACLEAVGLPLMLGAWGALLIGVLAFVPLEVARARYEEGFLRSLFGADYARYEQEVPGFVPGWRGCRIKEK